MAYKGVENNSSFSTEVALIADENGRDVMLMLAKATYDIHENNSLVLADEQQEVCFEGEYFGDPGASSLKIAPEANFEKLATDVVMIGHAHSPSGQPVTELDVGLKVGNLQQHIKVFGDRYWQKRTTGKFVNWIMSKPESFTAMPLVYERAFGGKDLTPDDKKHYTFEPRNLIGTGIIAKNTVEEQVAMPNLENPKDLIKSISDRPEPVGFGFIAPDWQPRLAYAGTYDKNWEKTRLPMLPKDFKKEFFNGAHPKLVANGFLEGTESVIVINATQDRARLGFNLPGDKPVIKFKFEYAESQPVDVKLDTVVINTDDMQVTLLWRAVQNVYNRVFEIEKVVFDNIVSNQIIPDDYEITV